MFINKEITISDNEWPVMQALWSKSPAYMNDIIRALKNTPWKRTTIQTMVARLASKKLIGINSTSKAFLYYPLISEDEAKRIYTKYFIDIVYKGNAFNSIANIISYNSLSINDIELID